MEMFTKFWRIAPPGGGIVLSSTSFCGSLPRNLTGEADARLPSPSRHIYKSLTIAVALGGFAGI
jgi:hypothetical protein